MRVSASGFLLTWMLGVVRVTAAEPETDIRFTALRPDGKPASGARVHAVTLPNGQASAEWRGKADANGVFQMPVHLIEPTGDFALRGIDFVRGLPVQGGIGLTAFTHRTGQLWCGEEVVPHRTRTDTSNAKPTRIILHPSIDVTGQVVDRASGAALPGVRVTAIAQGSIVPAPASTDEGGRFKLTHIPGYGLLRIDFERDGYATATVLPPSMPRHAVLRSVTPWKISLGRPTRVAGTIHDATSGGPTLVPVEIGLHTEELLPDGWMARTAGTPFDPSGNPLPNGQFDVWLPAGPAKLTVAASTIDGAYQQPYRQTSSIDVPARGWTHWSLAALIPMGLNAIEQAVGTGQMYNV